MSKTLLQGVVTIENQPHHLIHINFHSHFNLRKYAMERCMTLHVFKRCQTWLEYPLRAFFGRH